MYLQIKLSSFELSSSSHINIAVIAIMIAIIKLGKYLSNIKVTIVVTRENDSNDNESHFQ